MPVGGLVKLKLPKDNRAQTGGHWETDRGGGKGGWDVGGGSKFREGDWRRMEGYMGRGTNGRGGRERD